MAGMDEWHGPSDPQLAREVASYPGAENLLACLQCGVCTGSCPMADHMQDTPRRVIAHVIAGDRERALGSDAIWYCTACHACAVRCSAGISVPDVMAALKSLAAAVADDLDAAFAATFTRSVTERGRLYEAETAVRMGLARGIPAMARMAPMGFGLLRKGRLRLMPRRTGGAAEVATLARAVAKRREKAARPEAGHAVRSGAEPAKEERP